MCTLSWWISGERRGVFFNRDEKRTRTLGAPPELVASESPSLSYLAPKDPDQGGTWIGVNEAGLIVALLNNYPIYQENLAGQVSRGLLVSSLLKSCASTQAALDWLNQGVLSPYKGFLLFLMDAATIPRASSWDGQSLQAIQGNAHFLISSSVRKEACQTYRERLFNGAAAEPSALALVHRQYVPSDPALGPLMSRDDARTQSITEIELWRGAAHVQFFSVHEDTHQANLAHRYELALRQGS